MKIAGTILIAMMLAGCMTQVQRDSHNPPVLGSPQKLQSEALYSATDEAQMMVVQPPVAPMGSVRLQWVASDDPRATTYKIYLGTESRSYRMQIPVGNRLTAIVSNLNYGQKYFFVVTALDADGVESDFSGESDYQMPWRFVIRFSSPVSDVRVQRSTDLEQWQPCPDCRPVATNADNSFDWEVPSSARAAFFRGVGNKP